MPSSSEQDDKPAAAGTASSVAQGGSSSGGDGSRLRRSTDAELNYLNTVELLPGADNYLYDGDGSVALRPGMMTIAHGGLPQKALDERAKIVAQVKEARAQAAKNKKFGTCDGVIVRCLLNIWGVIMFLRMGFVVSHAGIYQAVLVVAASLALTVLTATSLSAIATNGEVEGGGAYFLISRSLGAESGGAIGLVFAVANAVSVSMYLIGFAETVAGLYGPGDVVQAGNGTNATLATDNYMTNREWDIRIIALIGLVVIMGVACAGADWVVKIDIGQLVVLVIGILTFFFGACFTIPSFDPVSGIAFTGFNASTFAANWHPDYRPTAVNPQGESFMSIFSVFFPAVTGMMAGANISGELRNAQKSLPFGTMLAVVLSNVVYMGIAVILGATCLRDGGQFGGLFGDSMIMIRISLFGPLVIVGIFASTISSALATLVGAPRILKAVCDDGLFPPLQYFAKSRESDNEPIRGYFLTAVIAVAGIMIGDLNAIAPLITNFFLATRALINFACFLASYSRSPGWRPTYRMYNKWVSLATALLCIAVMFAISWWQALITVVIGIFLYLYIRRTAPNVNWGAAELGLKWLQAKRALLQLDKVQLSHHVKTWRPIFLAVPLVFSHHVESMVEYAKQMEHANGFTIVADILVGRFQDLHKRLSERVQMRREAKGASKNSVAEAEKAEAVIKVENNRSDQEKEDGASGAAKGDSKNDDKSSSTEEAQKLNDEEKHVEEKHVRFGVAPTADDIFRGSGLMATASTSEVELTNVDATANGDEDDVDSSFSSDKVEIKRQNSMKLLSEGVVDLKGVLTETLIARSLVDGVRTMIQTSGVGLMRPNMLMLPTIPSLRNSNDFSLPTLERSEDYTDDMCDIVLSGLSFDFGVGLLSSPNPKGLWGKHLIRKSSSYALGCCNTRRRYGDKPNLAEAGDSSSNDNPIIDVYWVSDTGGCLLLIAYMHSQWNNWAKPCRLRIFVHSNKEDSISTTAKVMSMVSKFRIAVSEVIAIDLFSEPGRESLDQFPSVFDGDEEQVPSLKSEWNRRRTRQHLRIGEEIRKRSSASTFIYVTLPYPNLRKVESAGWQNWIDAVTGEGGEGPNQLDSTEYQKRPPICLLRGNQRNVLTYFS